MTRVQVLMDTQMHKQVKALAKKRNISTSKLIRNTIKDQLLPKKTNTALLLLSVEKTAKQGLPKDLSTNDSYIYGN